MFRNPRDRSSESSLPSVGRPPTPPPHPNSIIRNSSPYFGPTATPTPHLAGMKARFVQQSLASRSPAIGKKTAVATSNSRTKPQLNQSILNFFAKSDRSGAATSNGVDDQELFVKESNRNSSVFTDRDRFTTPPFLHDTDHLFEQDDPDTRYNECSSPVKRRRISSPKVTQLPTALEVGTGDGVDDSEIAGSGTLEPPTTRKTVRGPFIEESESEEEQDNTVSTRAAISDNFGSDLIVEEDNVVAGNGTEDSESALPACRQQTAKEVAKIDMPQGFSSEHPAYFENTDPEPRVRPSLTRESTSVMPMDEDEFDGMGDFEDEFFEEGEEYMERRWLEEQKMLEEGLDEDSKSESAGEAPTTPQQAAGQDPSVEGTACPICNESMRGTTEAEASAHVNGCLDGKPTPLPASNKKPTQFDGSEPLRIITGAKRFQRTAIARPPQENPFSLSKDGSYGSAFSKLMSGHAEDAAWAAAAANQVSSRGKPAYQRTCPFYKIMPGLYICVDAFRYGRVEGQNAYFLSHFHSDHYIGLTSSWCHGPIYCSKVTANLVRQQLKVDPKWVVDLEFEKQVEVPATQGVFVTMIPANHCPGSSLFLFEKVVGKGSNPKVNRILHCGDFRACPAHVNHPLLRPDVVDNISGKTRQQMIDTCYLDTTYLTPKYAFPSQEDVINACAEMCVSLSKEIPDHNDAWERAKSERAGSGMVKFLEKGYAEDNTPVKMEENAFIEREDNHSIKREDSTWIKKENRSLIRKKEDMEDAKPNGRGQLLVVIGTYSIGKERICLGIAKALNSKIYAPAPKQRICAALEDLELSSRLTNNPLEAQVHMQMLMEIRAETLLDYLQGYKSHFSRVVGFRPTGWNYRPPTSRFTENPAVSTVLNSEGWKSRFTMKDLVPQRGSSRESNCFGVPYSEHSSFRELTMFCCALRIGRIIPTVNVGSAKSREKMKMWIEKWEAEKKKSGLFQVEEGATSW